MNKILIAIMLLVSLCGCAKPNWVLVKQGEVERVEYTNPNFATSPRTIIYFKDGATCILNDHYSIPSKNIKVYQDKNSVGDDYKIEE